MKVLKFGGTSVGSADRMQEVVDIIEKNEGRQLIVLSAMSGTTNDLIAICESAQNLDKQESNDRLDEFALKYRRVLTDLFADKNRRDEARAVLKPMVELIRETINQPSFQEEHYKIIVAQGELFSTHLFLLLCKMRGLSAVLIPALAFMRIDESGEPNLELTEELARPIMDHIDEEVEIIITQGYICKNVYGQVDNLRRGGSDYSATILGAVLQAEEVQIWTDIDGGSQQ